MKIGVMSDTHISQLDEGIALRERLLAGPFADVEAILHAGDQVHPGLETCFSPLPWYAVKGNMDPSHCTDPLKRVVELGGVRIGMVHGFGAPEGIVRRVLAEFFGTPLDVLVFGHSHQPFCGRQDGLLLLNPGSPTDRRYAKNHTVALLTTEPALQAEIIRLD